MPIIVDRQMDFQIIQNIKNRFPHKNIIKSYPLCSVKGALSTHPDIQIHFLDYATAVCAPECYEYYKSNLGVYGIEIIKGKINICNTYPNDVAYNIARVGNYVIANTRYTDPGIIEYYNNRSFKIINTKQGYAKCNVCIADEGTVITGDPGIFKALSGLSDVKSLKIENGFVALSGFPYGFIGGASGIVDNVLVFCGKPNDSRITEFLNDNNIDYFFGAETGLRDYGSIICRR